MSDQELIKSIIRGDNIAMRELIGKYQDLVLNTCYKVLRSREDAEDISQEVFIETYRSAASLRAEDDVSYWLYRVSLNKSINHLRKSQNILFRSLLQIEALFGQSGTAGSHATPLSDDHPGEILESAERQEMLAKAVAALPAMQQKAFILHHYEDMPYKEICRVLNLSLPSVESLLFRARASLKRKCCPPSTDQLQNKNLKI